MDDQQEELTRDLNAAAPTGITAYNKAAVVSRFLAAGWTKRGDVFLLEDAELEALRKVAETATPGPWQMSGVRTKLGDPKFKRAQAHIIWPGNNGIILALFDTQTGEGFMDAKFIATFDTPTVLRLLDRLESALRAQGSE